MKLFGDWRTLYTCTPLPINRQVIKREKKKHRREIYDITTKERFEWSCDAKHLATRETNPLENLSKPVSERSETIH
jgi:hypothetical protein